MSVRWTLYALAALCVAAIVLVLPRPAHAPGGVLPVRAPAGQAAAKPRVRVWTISYRAHDGASRKAYVILPAAYGPGNNPRIPLVISPHGRGLSGRDNVKLWGVLPAIGGFAVVNPNGQGRALRFYSWGYEGQIEDLARMPQIVARALPWLRVDRRRVYAFGGSMGGQESLLLVARHPGLLAGAAVFDSVADLALQYRNFLRLTCDRVCRRNWNGPVGLVLQTFAQREIGGSPRDRPVAYAQRSPLTYASGLASSGVPLQIWWSTADEVVIDQPQQSGKLFWAIRRINPKAPVEAFIGRWAHSAEMNESSHLRIALATFGLLPPRFDRPPPTLGIVPPPVVTPSA